MKPAVQYEIKGRKEANSVKRIIEFALDGLVELVYDNHSLVRIEEYTWLSAKDWGRTLTGLKELLSASGSYEETRLLVRNREFTLVPDHVNSTKQQKEILNLLCGREVGSVRSESLKTQGACLIWGIEKGILDWVEQQFPDTMIGHVTQSLVNDCGSKSMQKEEVFLTIYTDYFEMLAFRDGELQILNTYDFKTDKDFIYILLTVLQKLDLNRETLRMNISGKIVPDSKLYKQLTTYNKYVQFLPFTLTQDLQQNIPLHHYPHLIHSSGLCEL